MDKMVCEKKGDQKRVRKIDDMGQPNLSKIIGTIAAFIAILGSTYHMIVAYIGVPTAFIHRPIHLSLIFSLLFLYYTPSGKIRDKVKVPWYDIILSLLAGSIGIYTVYNAERFMTRMFFVSKYSSIDILVGLILVLLILEATRRVIGKVLVLLVIICLIYALFGNYLPGVLMWHRGYSFGELNELLYMTTEGIWGLPIYVVSTYVYLFILFGAFLSGTGAGEMFTDLSRAISGKAIGGTAKTAVVASSLFGMLSGNSIANVMTTGVITIPAMIKKGYPSYFAASVEAAASTGGQIMPPVMATAAFLMAEFTGIPYIQIVKHAIIPAFLFYLGVFLVIHYESLKQNILGDPVGTLPNAMIILKKKGYLLLSIAVLIYLLINGYTAIRASLFSSITLLLLTTIFDQKVRKKILQVILDVLKVAPYRIMPAVSACACAGIIIGVLLITGLGARLASIILKIAGASIPIALILTMFLAILLGMGMPTSSAYIVVAILLAPGLVKIGIPLVVAHFFVLFFCVFSAVTPPVAVASYAAASLADAQPWKVGITSFRLSLVAFIIPYMFVIRPSLLLIGEPMQILMSLVVAIIGVISLASLLSNWFMGPIDYLEKIIFGAISILVMLFPADISDFIGIGLFTFLYLKIYIKVHRKKYEGEGR